ncbi:MAG: cysteine-rich CWC family protein, partial [Deltaproteobacteria bacterium]|nr:cysteine-rich CWC family protein [Deltaproteobacteria bacterium]MBW2447230.1 cysteine-rich CWC family protein [Deltaproteobacteria bacterium]
TPNPEAGSPRCPECGAEVRCGARLGTERCWCTELPPVTPDSELPEGACLCEACLKRRLAAQDDA